MLRVLHENGIGRSLDDRIRRLHDDAAGYIEAGMSWTEYWSTTRPRLNLFAEALVRRQAKQEQNRPR